MASFDDSDNSLVVSPLAVSSIEDSPLAVSSIEDSPLEDNPYDTYVKRVLSERKKFSFPFPQLSLEELELYNSWAKYWDQPFDINRKNVYMGITHLPVQQPSTFPPLHFVHRWNYEKQKRKVFEERVEKRRKMEAENIVKEQEKISAKILDPCYFYKNREYDIIPPEPMCDCSLSSSGYGTGWCECTPDMPERNKCCHFCYARSKRSHNRNCTININFINDIQKQNKQNTQM